MGLKLDKYASYYTANDILDENGKRRRAHLYTGRYYRYPVDAATFKKIKIVHAVFAAFCALVYACAAVFSGPSLGVGGAPAVYVAMPFVLLLLPIGMCLGKCAMFLTLPQRLEFPQFDRYVTALKAWVVLLIAFGAAALVGQIVYLILAGASAREIAFACLLAALTAAGALFLRFQGKYKCTIES